MCKWSFLISALTGLAAYCVADDFPPLHPAVQWLETERLRGVLFHNPHIQPMRPFWLLPAPPGPSAPAKPLTVVGENYFVLLPGRDKTVSCEITAISGVDVFPQTLYALYDSQGRELATGLVTPGKTARMRVAKQTAPCVLLVNSGPGMRNTACVRPLVPCWALEGRSHAEWDRTPLHLHFLRDLKLGGFNLAMIDFESLSEDFLTPQGLQEWKTKVKRWTDYARKVRLRVMPAVNLGGSPAEVRAWAGCRPGLYIEPDEKLPLAPCPLDRQMWEQLYLVRGRVVAQLSRDNPYIVGFGLDPEMYQAWRYGHYMLSGTCFCDYCFGEFLRAQKQEIRLLAQLKTGKERYEWLQTQKLYGEYEKRLEDEMAKIASWCRAELQKINPYFLTDMFVTEIGNWFCRGIARGLGRPGVPTVNFAEHTYYGVGYDPDWLSQMIRAYKAWGAEVLQGSAIWDVYFPATEPRFFAAHAYNLITKGQGYWYWPGDNLYRDWGCRFAYLDKPAWHDDYWPAAVWAHREADKWLRDRSYKSPLEDWAPVPWWGKYDEQKGGWQTDPHIVRPEPLPAYPVHILTPTDLYFRVRPDLEHVTISLRCRHAEAQAVAKLYNPRNVLEKTTEIKGKAESLLEVKQPAAGVWRISISPAESDAAPKEIMLALKGVQAYLASSPYVLPEALSKPKGLIGYWKLDEGRGDIIQDSSPPPLFAGTVHGAKWTAGKFNSGLEFDGRRAEAIIPVDEPFHNLKNFSLCAWIKLKSQSEKGKGRTIVNKGPEMPVQHFWWWIGYPPEYALILEMGNEKYQWGTSFATGALQWELGRFYHVAVTCERQGNKVVVCHYRDGQLVGRSEKEEELHSGSYDLRIGSYGGLHFMDGIIDEIKFFNVALTPEQIAQEASAH